MTEPAKTFEIIEHESLSEALIYAMAEYPPLEQARVVDFYTKDNRHIYYHYADLADTRKATDPALNKHGLEITDHIEMREGSDALILITTLTHAKTKEERTTELNVGVNSDMKEFAGNVTYARRYNYWLLSGRVGEADSEERDLHTEEDKNPPTSDTKGKSKPDAGKKKGNATGAKSDDDKYQRAAFDLIGFLGKADEMKAECIELFSLKESRSEMTMEQWKSYLDKLKKDMTDDQTAKYDKRLSVFKAMKPLKAKGVKRADILLFLKCRLLIPDPYDTPDITVVTKMLETGLKNLTRFKTAVSAVSKWGEDIGGAGKADDLLTNLDRARAMADEMEEELINAFFRQKIGLTGTIHLDDIPIAEFGGWSRSLELAMGELGFEFTCDDIQF